MTNIQILVVEDEGIIAKDIQNMLNSLGYAVPAVASSGKEAIKKAAETHPNLVLMDIVLEGDMDGVEATEQIRERFDIPVIYITAYGDDKTLQRAKITEPYGYILKPFEERELQTAIEMALYKHKMESRLRQSEKWLSTILRSIGDAVIATDMKGFITFMNPVAEALTGWQHEDAKRKPLKEVFNIVNENTQNSVEDLVARGLRQGAVVELANHTLLTAKNGKRRPVDVRCSPITDDKGGITGVVFVFTDITERRRAEEVLQEKEKKLEGQARRLEKVNTALSVLLEHREEEKKRFGEDILTNTKKLIFPYIEKLEKSTLSTKNQAYLSIIKSNLNDLISPFASRLSSKYLDFTPTEIEIAECVRQGKTSKEIASLLNVSCKAVSLHRYNIRKKLGLSNTKTNLRSYLQSLSL